MEIAWLGHASFKITADDILIYIDPFKLDASKISHDKLADIVLCTHSHFDHFSLEDIKKISKPQTIIVATKDCAGKVPNLKTISPGETLVFSKVKISAVHAYNKNKQYHPKINSWCGYVVEIDGKRIYHAGDTDAIPEMDGLKGVDVALLPVGGTYTMTAEEAAMAANRFKPKIAVPMHYGSIVGQKTDAEKFKQFFKGKTLFLDSSIVI
ncbi:MAG: MBL fold metallo-hydrolase [Candidatus Woesearchaeota archaeon]